MIQTFLNDFNRFYDMLIQQVDTCPDEIWTLHEGGYVYWEQILHTVGITELYAGSQGLTPYDMDVLMFRKQPERVLSRAEMKTLMLNIRPLATDYINSLTPVMLMEMNQPLTARLKRDVTHLSNLIAMVRHMCYHIGCCDTVLRSHGIAGVY
jgi:hypothetical protein